ncbi:NFACT RNA binding domain-containing protein [Candidatus Altiarchaeota archaeon]
MVEVKIDLKKSVSGNAQTYYEKAKKAKKKIPGLLKAMKETKAKLDDLKVEEAAPFEQVIQKKRKKKWYEGYRWFTSSDGLLVVGGKDASTNETLMKKHVEGKDLVFHANIMGAPFFIVKNPEGNTIPEATIEQAAQAAASYSKAWGRGMGSADVYYIDPEQVSKTPPSGEYLPKGSFMIRGEKNWVKNVQIRLAIGFIAGDDIEVVGGPVDAVSARTKYYSAYTTGDEKSKKLAEGIIRSVLRQTPAEMGRKIKKIGLDELQRWIPTGKGRLIKG